MAYLVTVKYVILQHKVTGAKMPVLLPEALVHACAAEGHKVAGFFPVTAGFVELYTEDGNVQVTVHGESESLGLKSAPDDVDLILAWLCYGDSGLNFINGGGFNFQDLKNLIENENIGSH